MVAVQPFIHPFKTIKGTPGTVLGDGTKAKGLPLWHDVA